MRSDDAGTGFEAIAAVGADGGQVSGLGKKGGHSTVVDGCLHVRQHGGQAVNRRMTEAEMLAIRTSVNRGAPWGNPNWQKRTAGRLGLESSLRPKGRPRLEKKK